MHLPVNPRHALYSLGRVLTHKAPHTQPINPSRAHTHARTQSLSHTQNQVLQTHTTTDALPQRRLSSTHSLTHSLTPSLPHTASHRQIVRCELEVTVTSG